MGLPAKPDDLPSSPRRRRKTYPDIQKVVSIYPKDLLLSEASSYEHDVARRTCEPGCKPCARLAVRRALQTGELIKAPCVICGDLKVGGHHEDYKRPLDVTWLCEPCHDNLHGIKPAQRRFVDQSGTRSRAKLQACGVYYRAADRLARSYKPEFIERWIAAWQTDIDAGESLSPGALVWRIENAGAPPVVAARDAESEWLERRYVMGRNP